MAPNKVLVISTMYPSKTHPSFGVFVRNQVELLRTRGYHVDVLAIKNPKMGKANVIQKYACWFLKGLYLFLLKGRSYSVVHAHYIFPSGWLALQFKRFFKAKMIITAHGGDVDKMAQLHPFLYQQTKRILEKTDEVIVVGEVLREKVTTEFNITSDKVTLLAWRT